MILQAHPAVVLQAHQEVDHQVIAQKNLDPQAPRAATAQEKRREEIVKALLENRYQFKIKLWEKSGGQGQQVLMVKKEGEDFLQNQVEFFCK